jgi:hypothetical protein
MKNKSLLIVALCVASLSICAPQLASAARKKAASPAPNAGRSPAATTEATGTSPAKAQRAIPFKGMIQAVDKRAKTFTIAGKQKSRVFKITDKTVMTKAGNPATMKDVVENEEVRGSYWKNADGSMEAKTMKLGPLTEQEKAAMEARRAKRAEKKKEKEAAESAASAAPSASP